jgi:SHAQKYF class myb-like DNA-binding protein
MSRKQRRCWSPELHRRFVNALNQLGGSQVATPKQIRELMKVDGLTNDEVKSHLQVSCQSALAHEQRCLTSRPVLLPCWLVARPRIKNKWDWCTIEKRFTSKLLLCFSKNESHSMLPDLKVPLLAKCRRLALPAQSFQCSSCGD